MSSSEVKSDSEVPIESGNVPSISTSITESKILKNISPQEIFGKLQPLAEKLIDLCTFLLPYYHLLQQKWSQLWLIIEPYYNEYYSSDMKQIFLGIVLLLFGGQFSMTIACYTAIQLSSWLLLKKSYKKIKTNYDLAMDAFKNSKSAKAMVDTNNDGYISLQEKLSFLKVFINGSRDEKLMILNEFRCIFIAIDPQEIMMAVSGFWAVCITVIATLRSKFAKDVALGVNIGDMMCKSVAVYIRPWLRRQFNEDMKQWSDFLLDIFFRFIGISLALMIVRMTSAFHSAVKGAHLLTLYLFKFLRDKEWMAVEMVNIESHKFFVFVQYALAFWGFFVQFRAGFAVGNIFLRLFLMPFSITEAILTLFAVY